MSKFKTIAVLVFFILTASVSAQVAGHPVIAEIYGGGGNSGSYYKYDYIILYNPTAQDVDLSAWSVQYASATSGSWTVTNLAGIIYGYNYYVIQQKGGTKGGEELPMTPDIIGTTSLATTGGKVALVCSQEQLALNDPTGDLNVIDFVGYGSADAFEGTGPSPSPSNTESIRRLDNNGEQTMNEAGSGFDSDDNSTDFFVAETNSDNPPLPVELSLFGLNISGKSIILNWETATEVNNYGFEVQKGEEIGVSSQKLVADWKKIGFVNGSGNSNKTQKYHFTDYDVENGLRYAYRLKQIDNDGRYTFTQEKYIYFGGPDKIELYQNYPNPFNPSTIISYDIPEQGYVELKIYNILGREICTLVSEHQQPGSHKISFDARNLGSGIYFYRLKTSGYVLTRAMSLTK